MATKTRKPDRAEPPGAGDEQEEVQQFLDTMADALTAGDGWAVADLWETPALVLGDGEAHGINTLEEAADFFGRAREQYNEKGVSDTRPEIMELIWLTPRIAEVRVRWPYLDDEGDEMGEETSSYTLRRNDMGRLKLRAAVMQGASE